MGPSLQGQVVLVLYPVTGEAVLLRDILATGLRTRRTPHAARRGYSRFSRSGWRRHRRLRYDARLLQTTICCVPQSVEAAFDAHRPLIVNWSRQARQRLYGGPVGPSRR